MRDDVTLWLKPSNTAHNAAVVKKSLRNFWTWLEDSIRLQVCHQTYHATENINNVRYDDPRKLMKQTSLKVKNFKGPIPRRAIHYQIKFYSQEYLIHSELNDDYQI